MVYNLNDPRQRDRFRDRTIKMITKQHDGDYFVELTHKRVADGRSNSQNRYLHMIFSLFSNETGIEFESVKSTIFKQMVNPDLFVRKSTIKDSNISFNEIRSSADLDSREMTIAIERFRDFASKELGIYIPEPNEDEILESLEQHLSTYQNLIHA